MAAHGALGQYILVPMVIKKVIVMTAEATLVPHQSVLRAAAATGLAPRTSRHEVASPLHSTTNPAVTGALPRRASSIRMLMGNQVPPAVRARHVDLAMGSG